MKIVFMGTPDFAEVSLKKLYEDKFDIVGVVTNPDKQKNRGMKLAESEVKVFAKEKNMKIFLLMIVEKLEQVMSIVLRYWLYMKQKIYRLVSV